MTGRIRGAWRFVVRLAPYAIVLLVAAAAVAPALNVDGIVATRHGGDSPFLLVRTQAMSTALASGHIPPRWMPDAAYGLGYPFWNFYAPLAYIGTAVVSLLGGGAVGAIKVWQLLWFAIAAVGAHKLGTRMWGAVSSGVLTAVAYTVAPYHIVNVYVRGDALSEIAAYALFPWVLIAVDRAVEKHDAATAAGLAFVTGLLLVSHNISALLFSPLLVAFALWRLVARSDWWARRRARGSEVPDRVTDADGAKLAAASSSSLVPLPRSLALGPALIQRATLSAERRLWPWRRRHDLMRIAVLGGGLLLGAALAMWFWAPALLESDAVRLSDNLTGHFDYRGHFLGLDLVDRALAFDYADETPWRIGLVQLVVALLGAAAALRLRGRRAVLAFWALAALAATFLITSLSGPVWSATPLLAFAQFPWRWLAVQALALALLSGALGAHRRGPLLVVGAATFLVLAGLWRVPVETLHVRDALPTDVAAFEVFSGNIGSTVRSEYLPTAAVPRPWSGIDVIYGREGQPRALEAPATVEAATLVKRSSASQTWKIETSGGSEITVAFPTLAFPGWVAEVERSMPGAYGLYEGPSDVSAPQPVGVVNGSGWMTVNVPDGEHVVRLTLERSGTRAVSEAVSLVALLVLLLIIVGQARWRLGRAILVLIATLLIVTFTARMMPKADALGPRTMDYGRTPYPHFNPHGITYGDTKLVDASLNYRDIEAGGELRVQLTWDEPSDAYQVEAALVSPAAAMPPPGFDVPDVRAVDRQSQTDMSELSLLLPADVPSGLYVVRLRVTDADGDVPAVSAEGYEVEPAHLGPVRVRGKDQFRDRPPTPVARYGDIVLHELSALQDGDRLEVRMHWEIDRETAREYKTSVRLKNHRGDTIAQQDRLPLYGFLPTTAWEKGGQVLDRRWLDIPSDVADRGDYVVEVVVYEEVAIDQALGSGEIGGVKVSPP